MSFLRLRRPAAVVLVALTAAFFATVLGDASADAATTQVRVGAGTAAVRDPAPNSADYLPGVATGIMVTADRPVTITASGSANCLPSDPAQATTLGCLNADANGSAKRAEFDFLAPRLRPYSLVAQVGDGPKVQVGTGPTVVTGVGELRLGYNDEIFYYYDNVGGFDVTVTQPDPPRAAQLHYTGPTRALLVLSRLPLSATLSDVDGGTPTGRLDQTQLRFTVRDAGGSAVAGCTAPVQPSSPTAGRAGCSVPLPGLLKLGEYRVTVELVGNADYVAPPVRVGLRVVGVL